MAHFIAEIEGRAKRISRIGHKTTGIRSHTRGWNFGVEVIGYFDEEIGEDVFKVTLTGGSNDPFGHRVVGEFSRKNL